MHRVALIMTPTGFIAVLAGWVTTEVGAASLIRSTACSRPAQSLSPVAAPAVGASLVAFVIIYFAVYAAGVFYMLRLVKKSPDYVNPEIEHRPMHAAGITQGPALAAGE